MNLWIRTPITPYLTTLVILGSPCRLAGLRSSWKTRRERRHVKVHASRHQARTLRSQVARKRGRGSTLLNTRTAKPSHPGSSESSTGSPTASMSSGCKIGQPSSDHPIMRALLKVSPPSRGHNSALGPQVASTLLNGNRRSAVWTGLAPTDDLDVDALVAELPVPVRDPDEDVGGV